MTPMEQCDHEIAELEAGRHEGKSYEAPSIDWLLGWADWHKEKRLIEQELALLHSHDLVFPRFLDGDILQS